MFQNFEIQTVELYTRLYRKVVEFKVEGREQQWVDETNFCKLDFNKISRCVYKFWPIDRGIIGLELGSEGYSETQSRIQIRHSHKYAHFKKVY